MSAAQPQTLQVEGAKLWYEVRGAGPVLLLIPGGNGDATPYRAVADLLSTRFTVATYDRRGFSRSTLDHPPDDGRRLEFDGDDARQLIEHLSREPAYVFGSSSGAIVALDLLSRYPQHIRKLVAHEPPLAKLLPDAQEQLAILDEVYDTFRLSGTEVAMREFVAAAGIEDRPALPPGAESDPRVREMMERMRRNLEFWFVHELRQYPRVVPDMAKLETLTDRLVLAGGHDSRTYFSYRPNTVLADRLHLRVIDFPGGHLGYVTRATEFGTELSRVLLDPANIGHRE